MDLDVERCQIVSVFKEQRLFCYPLLPCTRLEAIAIGRPNTDLLSLSSAASRHLEGFGLSEDLSTKQPISADAHVIRVDAGSITDCEQVDSLNKLNEEWSLTITTSSNHQTPPIFGQLYRYIYSETLQASPTICFPPTCLPVKLDTNRVSRDQPSEKLRGKGHRPLAFERLWVFPDHPLFHNPFAETDTAF